MSTPSIYVAGSSRDLPRARAAMALATEIGFRVALDWTHSVEANGSANDVPRSIAAECARADLRAVAGADVLWLLLGDEPSRGAHVELGARLVGPWDSTVILSGGNPRASIFYAGLVHFETDAEVRTYLTGFMTTWRPR